MYITYEVFLKNMLSELDLPSYPLGDELSSAVYSKDVGILSQ